jgi:hypothetical protein
VCLTYFPGALLFSMSGLQTSRLICEHNETNAWSWEGIFEKETLIPRLTLHQISLLSSDVVSRKHTQIALWKICMQAAGFQQPRV